MTIPTSLTDLFKEIEAAKVRLEDPRYAEISEHPWRQLFKENELSWHIHELLGEPGEGVLDTQTGHTEYRTAWIEAVAWLIRDLQETELFWFNRAYDEAHDHQTELAATPVDVPAAERL